MFDPGKTYLRRNEVHARVGGQWQSGISTPTTEPLILIFTGIAGGRHGYRDRWLDDDTFEYWGEGQVGDMEFTRGNRALRDHLDDGKAVHLFETLPGKTGRVRYVAEMLCIGTRLDRGLDRNGSLRQEIVFQLVRQTAVAGDDAEAEAERGLRDLGLEDLRRRALDVAAADQSPAQRLAAYRNRSAAVRLYALARAQGICEGCEEPAPFVTLNGNPYLEVHHIRSLSDGGPDHPRWVIALCPTCHRRVHNASDGASYNQGLAAIVGRLEASPPVTAS